MKYKFKKLMLVQLMCVAFVFLQSSLLSAGIAPVTKDAKKKGDDIHIRLLATMFVASTALVVGVGSVSWLIYNRKKTQDTDKAINHLTGLCQSNKSVLKELRDRTQEIESSGQELSGKARAQFGKLVDELKAVKAQSLGAKSTAEKAQAEVNSINAKMKLPRPVALHDLTRAIQNQRDNFNNLLPGDTAFDLFNDPGRGLITKIGVSDNLFEVLNNQALLNAFGVHNGSYKI
ncbi:MAG: hypothetical protein OXE99_03340 [Cellvibrionales bacterium]|nr:hypothetical protein [Cellvibrionales bacterium]